MPRDSALIELAAEATVDLARGVPALHPERRGMLNISPRKNWVEKRGGLPPYLNSVATALLRQPMFKGNRQRAIKTAVNVMKKTCATGYWGGPSGRRRIKISAAIQAAACNAVRQWEQMKVATSVPSDTQFAIDLAAAWEPAIELAKTGGGPQGTGRTSAGPRSRTGGGPQGSGRTTSGGRSWSEEKHPRAGKGQKVGRSKGGQFIAKGASGEEVKAIQRELGITADGEFGPKTAAAVRAYQRKHGLKVDGIVGRQTAGFMRDRGKVKPGGLSSADRKFLRERGVRKTDTSATEAEVIDLAVHALVDRRRLAARGQALPGGRFPIADREDLRKAIRAVGRAKGSHARVRAFIIRRARVLGAMDMVPDYWKMA